MEQKMILQTERLFLREMSMDDFDALYKVLADPDIMQHYPYSFDEERVRGWIERNINRYRDNGFGLWAVCLKETGEMIGDCGLTLQNIEGKMLPEIGYHIRADRQRRGYAKEAAAAVRDWAFANTDYPALYSYCKYTNTGSFKTAESIGMHFEKEYPDPDNEITHVSVIYRDEASGNMGKDISYRLVRREDGYEWFTLLAKVWRSAYSHIFPPEVFDERDRNVEYKASTFTEEKFQSDRMIGYVAECDGKIVGMMFGMLDSGYEHFKDGYADLVALYVYPEYQGLGIGTALKDIFVEWAKGKGAERFVVGVLKDNVKARKVYESWGGTLSGYEHDFVVTGKGFPESFYTFEL